MTRSRARAALALLAAVAIVTAARLWICEIPFERDEGFYAAAGQLILSGASTFQAIHYRFTLIYPIYALIISFFGQSAAGVHCALALVNAATMVFVYRLGSRLLGRASGVFAAAAYGFLALSPLVLGQAANLEHFVLFFGLGGLALLLDALESRRLGLAAAAGALLGAATLVKQPGLLLGLIGGAQILWELRREARTGLRLLGAYAAGLAVLPVLVCAYAWKLGVWPQFWYWNVSYSTLLGSLYPWRTGLGSLLTEMFRLGPAAPVFWALAAAGLVLVAIEAFRGRPLLAALAVAGLAMAVAPRTYRQHYYILLLPGAALAAAAMVEEVRGGRWLPASVGRLRPAIVATLWFAALEPLLQNTAMLCRVPREAFCALVYGGNAFSEAVPISEYIRTHSGPHDRVLVLGSESEVYFYSRRKPANKYLDIYTVTEAFPGARQRQEQFIEESEASKPKFAVVAYPIGGTSWIDTPATKETLVVEWGGRFLSRRYHLVGKAYDSYRPFCRAATPATTPHLELYELNSPELKRTALPNRSKA